MERGKFITFEGGEGCGKSTQIRLLKDYLEVTHQSYLLVREPGGNKISEKIRSLILDVENAEMTGKCEAMLYSAARAQLLAEVIEPALEKGVNVICDRFIDSTFAYQGYARGLGIDYICKLNELTCGKTLPDITIYLDLEPSVAFKRKGGADLNDRMEKESLDFHNKVYWGYKIAIEMYKDRIISIYPTGSVAETNITILRTLKAKGIIK